MSRWTEIFEMKMINEELSQSRKHGVKVVIPIRSFIKNEKSEIKQNFNIQLNQNLIDLYKEIDSQQISWSISNRDQNTIDLFKEDPWLIENYFNQGYDWAIVHEMLSGFINIQKLEDMFNPVFCREQSYFYTMSNIDNYNPDNFIPFDIHWGLTACLKRENSKIVDNVWLVHTDANAVYDMQISIADYLNLAYQAKGFHYWQLIYIFKEKSTHYELMKRFLPNLVPHIELDLSGWNIN